MHQIYPYRYDRSYYRIVDVVVVLMFDVNDDHFCIVIVESVAAMLLVEMLNLRSSNAMMSIVNAVVSTRNID